MKPEGSESSSTLLEASQSFWGILGACEGALFTFHSADEWQVAGSCFDVRQSVGQPLLAGNSCDMLLITRADFRRHECLECIENSDYIIGMARLAVTSANLEAESLRAYRAIIEATGTRHLYRIWNFVPKINHNAPGAMEHYKLFCSGRARAFGAYCGKAEQAHFPSASATGCRGDYLTIVFLAGVNTTKHWENPEQVPAYQYPEQYGPNSPSFARGSRFIDAKNGEWIFIAGTAAIKGSESLHPGDFNRQLAITFDNLDLVLGQVGLSLATKENRRRHFKVFLRNRKNLLSLHAELNSVLGPADSFSIVEADICRAELEVEIELTVFPAYRA